MSIQPFDERGLRRLEHGESTAAARGIADSTLAGPFSLRCSSLLPRLRRSRGGFDGLSCAYYGMLQTHSALEAGTDKKVNGFLQLARTTEHYVAEKTTLG
jgi:hypothetical protein